MNRVPPPRGFSRAEYQARVEAVQAKMAQQKVTCILLTTEADIRYFSGFHSQFWQSPTRPWFVLIPSTGEPVAIIPEIGKSCMKKGWLKDIRTWSSPHESDDGCSLVVDAIAELSKGVAHPKVGLMKGRETHLHIPLQSFETITASLGDTYHYCDVSEIVLSVRQVKSEAEINKVRYVCQTVSQVFAELPQWAHIGMTDIDIFRAFKVACLQAGVDDVAYLVGAADQGGYDDIISPPSGRAIRSGDVLILDTGCTYDGYYCDFDRNYAFGTIDKRTREAHETVWQATEAALSLCRPGIRVSELFTAMNDVLQAGGAMGDAVGRYGHGLGIQLTESPSNTVWDQTKLQSGMIMTLEPGMLYATGRMIVHEENLVIRDDGAEMLSERAPREMPLISEQSFK